MSEHPRITATRCRNNPLITFASAATLGDNINGPSVIRAPAWLERPLGRYYLYFAHHEGDHIRLAYADALEGPWQVYEPGTLRLDQAPAFVEHIASPDVHIDDERREIRMYFHGPVPGSDQQRTGVAISRDGLNFRASDQLLGPFYFRVFRWNGWYYAIAKRDNSGWGELLRSRDGLTPFESRGEFIEWMRHAAVMLRDNRLLVFYSRKGDTPERIVATMVALEADWTAWNASEPVDVLRPEAAYEGIEFPLTPSAYGAATHVRQLRDPGIFEEHGRTYLFYSIAGEMGIALAELNIALAPLT